MRKLRPRSYQRPRPPSPDPSMDESFWTRFMETADLARAQEGTKVNIQTNKSSLSFQGPSDLELTCTSGRYRTSYSNTFVKAVSQGCDVFCSYCLKNYFLFVEIILQSIGHWTVILRAKNAIEFTPHFSHFYRQAHFRMLQRPPESDSWGFHGGIPPVGPREAPQSIFGKKYLRPGIPNSRKSCLF